MAEDGWKTYPIEFKGGLVSNLSLLQQGINAPGSARILKNFEPSIQGGYRRVLGYAKYDSNIIPPYRGLQLYTVLVRLAPHLL